MLKSSTLIAFLLLQYFINFFGVIAFNISPVPNLEIKQPNLPTSLPQTRSSYFGFSIVLRQSSILIGAPRAQSTLVSQSTINETGAVYRCPFQFRGTQMIQSPAATCKPYVFENSSNLYYRHDHLMNEIRDNQWLGATMDGSTADNEPLLVCAPRFDGGERYNEEIHDYLHGICYSTDDTLDDVPSSFNFFKLKPLTKGYQVYDEVYFYQLGQMGFSAHITPNNKEFIMGAPGVNNWSGTAVRFDTRTRSVDIPSNISKNDLVLTGYAVASGYLSSVYRNELYYVTTSPHENMERGQVYIYQYNTFKDEIVVYGIFKGSQYGEYYGYAVIVCDINGDQLDDIVVTAPQYRLHGTIDIGAIYVYTNVGNFQFRRQIIKAPFTTEARFGSTIMNLGDINQDGFNDIAVGAPFVDGNGAVAIYFGNANGMESQPSQVINAPKNTNLNNTYFGYGLSKGVDIDGNGCNDLAIGAPNADMVYIYRSYPVINIITTIATTTQRLDLQAEYIEYRICFRTDSDMIVLLQLDIKADVKLRRIAFEDNNSHQLQVQVLAAKFEKCHTFNASIIFLSSQIFVPIKTTVTHSLVNDGRKHMNQSFCTSCATLDPRISNTTFSVISYHHGCAKDMCEVDLTIEALNLPSELIIGSSKILPIKYLISNKKEKAFDTKVTISNSLNLTLARTPSNCYEGDIQQVICDIAKDQIFLQDLEYLNVDFDLSYLNDKDEITITAMVTSMGNEQNYDDNKSELKIKLKSYSDLEVVCIPNENFFLMGDDIKLIDFEYVCKLQNMGPSPIRNVDFSLEMPITFDTKNYIEHLNLNVTYENGEMPHTDFEMLPTNQQTESDAIKNVTYHTRREQLRLPYNRTILQYCNQNASVTCAKSLFKLSLLEAGKSLTINIGASLKADALRNILENGRFLALFVNLTAQISASYEGFLNITQIISPIVVQNRMAAETPLWVYVVAIITGILVLMLFILTLWKFGFFKRQSKDDMQQLLNEKIESERMKEETELNNGTANDNFEDIDISKAEREV